MSPPSEIRRARPLLGTLVEITAGGEYAPAAIEAAFREVEAIHGLMSFHESGSDISRINRAPLWEPVSVDERTYDVLAFAQKLSVFSQGAFDVTVGGALVKAGFLPAPDGAGECDTDACYTDLMLLPENRAMRTRYLWIDLGGIAKGYAVDRAVETLRAQGVENGLVNAGGDLRVFGTARPVHIRHPLNPSQVIALGEICDRAVASSSGIFSEDKSADPIVGGKECLRWREGVTVLADECMLADGLTKILRLASDLAPQLLTRFQAQGLLIGEKGIRLLPDGPNNAITAGDELPAHSPFC